MLTWLLYLKNPAKIPPFSFFFFFILIGVFFFSLSLSLLFRTATTTTIRFDSGVSCCSAYNGTGHPTPTTILKSPNNVFFFFFFPLRKFFSVTHTQPNYLPSQSGTKKKHFFVVFWPFLCESSPICSRKTWNGGNSFLVVDRFIRS